MSERTLKALLFASIVGTFVFLPLGATLGWRMSESRSNHRSALRPVVDDFKTIVTIDGNEVRTRNDGSAELVRKHDVAGFNSGEGFVRFVLTNYSVDITEAIYCIADDRIERVAPTLGQIYEIERIEPHWYYVRSEH